MLFNNNILVVYNTIYTHTQTHTHIYIYIYMVIKKHVFIYDYINILL